MRTLSLRTLGIRFRAVCGNSPLSCVPNQTINWSTCEQSALAWLSYARTVSGDGGVPAFYSILYDWWAPSYPETTGYLIPTLLHAATYYGEYLRTIAVEMADYVLHKQTESGAIPTWGENAPIYVFDTGQALQGFVAIWEATGEERFRLAALRAADWLLSIQHPAGFWDSYQYCKHAKTWDVRVAWALIQAGFAFHRPDYIQAGRQCMNWALTQQARNGWFKRCMMKPGEPSVLHTIAYAIEGLLRGGLLTGESQYIEAAKKAADALLNQQRTNGSLPSYWREAWQPVDNSSCLSGEAQMACCWFWLFKVTGKKEYAWAAHRILVHVASTQSLNDLWKPTKGAIAGSWPIWGKYMRLCYPNWAVKFFLDASLLQRDLGLADEMEKILPR